MDIDHVDLLELPLLHAGTSDEDQTVVPERQHAMEEAGTLEFLDLLNEPV